MLQSFLPHKDLIGLNYRNVELINELNPVSLIRNVNDKVRTKQLASEVGIPTPRLLGKAETWRECQSISLNLDPKLGGVLKPANGAKGSGVEVILSGNDQSGWRFSNGNVHTDEDIVFHASNIVSGMFNPTGILDVAMVEERVIFDDVFRDLTYKGVPDIRVIVLKGVPIAAMLRLPTSKSDGKANLHRGGVGVGINLRDGRTVSAMMRGRFISHHPDTNTLLRGFEIPNWNDILLMSARCFDVTGLGYFGADIVLDKAKGPLLLELNARPGLSIQFAMNKGLGPLMKPFLAPDFVLSDVHERVEKGKLLWS